MEAEGLDIENQPLSAGRPGQRLNLPVIGAGDKVVLEIGRQIGEVGAAAGHPDNEAAPAIRILLGGQEGLLIYDIELNMPQLQIAESPDNGPGGVPGERELGQA
jgi:hypothetical protein